MAPARATWLAAAVACLLVAAGAYADGWGEASAVAASQGPPSGGGRPSLSVRQYPEGPVLLRVALTVGDGAFALVYRHSVERTWVLERWRVACGTEGDNAGAPAGVLVMEGMAYRSLGAGLPVEGQIGQGVDGPVLTVSSQQILDNLVLGVLPLTEHALWLPDGRHIPLPADRGALILAPGCGAETEESPDG
ncbi:DUF1850 domain-containing protein [Geochorda subterranea]|uniref:DUF1850 domain-containing protein n=1 Tax=Geochorda subterranea TaxID=3109564 RepID=A0ABZ1BT37_9FIRM|nr:DUF1850 domain-containing protein [Limnochorda sp. LNt]WRP15307.1 DUF1850 domain-containing protein [Limnochorda sp. LNt]